MTLSQPAERIAVAIEAKTTRVFISYRSQEPDQSLAQQVHDALVTAGYMAFMAGESIHMGEKWVQRIDQELQECDYFLLLLSPQAAISEMVMEEVRRAKQLQDSRPNHQPMILPIRVNFPLNSPLSYNLRGYLHQIQQREWKSFEDTPRILGEILGVIETHQPFQQTVEELEPPVLPYAFFSTSLPLPVAEPELPEGQVDLASAFYVERPPIEERCYEAIVKPGALIRIKAPRQMGKTSLMARIMQHAGQQGYRTVPLSFQIADAAIFSDLDRFLKWFCASVTRRLRLPNRVAEFWDEIFGSKDNCTAYFEEYLLPEITDPLVLCLDEVDMVFNHAELAADFFGLLRAWHESAKNLDLWKRLRLVVVHSTEVYIPMNVNQSPFNVGLPIELPEFTTNQVKHLAHRHGLGWTTADVEQLMAMVGGHPYLVRTALYHIARRDLTLQTLLETAPTDAGLYGDHLRRHLWNLERHSDMAFAVKRLVATKSPVRLESVQAFQLYSMGLVHLQGNDVTFRCDLYRHYFRDRLGSTWLPFLPACNLKEENILAAIVFTDVVNSTSRMAADQAHTLELVNRDFQQMIDLCQEFEGLVLKSTGDGLLMYFASAVKAVACALEIQRSLTVNTANLSPEDVLIHRIGVHLGEVMFSGMDVMGVGVNIAARLQARAEPGKVCISQTVYDVIKNHLSLQVTSLGNCQLKGLAESMLLYQVAP